MRKLLIALVVLVALLMLSCLPISESRFGDACNNCAGTGKDAIGGVCGACGGSGIMRIQTWPRPRADRLHYFEQNK